MNTQAAQTYSGIAKAAEKNASTVAQRIQADGADSPAPSLVAAVSRNLVTRDIASALSVMAIADIDPVEVLASFGFKVTEVPDAFLPENQE